MQIIESFRALLQVDPVAWIDGPGWLAATLLSSGAIAFIVGSAPRDYR
jgi:hypothetical protein